MDSKIFLRSNWYNRIKILRIINFIEDYSYLFNND